MIGEMLQPFRSARAIAILPDVEIRLEVQAHAKDVSLVRIAAPLSSRKFAVVLCQSLSRVVVKLNTAEGLAEGVEGVK